MSSAGETPAAGGAGAPPFAAPSRTALRWLLGIRLVVISTLFLGILIIQVNTQLLLQLEQFYWLILVSYGLSLGYLVLYLKGLETRLQAVIQLLGDIGVVSGFVYVTGGLYSPFSFLYLTVILVAATMLRRGGLVFAGLSAIAYGILVDLMALGILAPPAGLSGIVVPLSTSRVLYQLMIHVVGFILVALLVSYLSESLRTARFRLREETERAQQFVALTDQVVRSVSAGILAADLEGKVLHVNPAGARILMIADEATVVGKPLEEVMPLVTHDWGSLRTRARTDLLGRLESSFFKISGADLFFGVAGTLAGLLIALLPSIALFRFGYLGYSVSILLFFICGYGGLRICIVKRSELSALFNLGPSFTGAAGGTGTARLLDTSVIIDGRIVDIAKAGFLEGAMVVPRFVLNELQSIADSGDTLKRNRGRRGLDVLNALQRLDNVTVEVTDQDFPEIGEVDAKLVELAKLTGMPLTTNDFNLNRVAEIQGVKILNINELSNVLKPVVLPGEELEVKIIREGKEPGQGVGYLDDGTMVVVQQGSRKIGEQVTVVATSVLQTPAGKMIFTELKDGNPEA